MPFLEDVKKNSANILTIGSPGLVFSLPGLDLEMPVINQNNKGQFREASSNKGFGKIFTDGLKFKERGGMFTTAREEVEGGSLNLFREEIETL